MKLNKSINNKYFIYNLILSIVIAIILSTTFITGISSRFENVFSDFLTILFHNPKKASPQIVLALTSQQCLLEGEKYYHMTWPWKRSIYSKLINYLNLSGVKIIVFDALFSEKSVYRDQGMSDDEDFSKGIAQSKNIIIGFQLGHTNSKSNVLIGIPKRFEIPLFSNISNFYFKKYNIAHLPIKTLMDSSSSIGAINSSEDEDGIIRRMHLLLNYQGKYYPSLALSAFLKYKSSNKMELLPRYLKMDQLQIPLDKNGLFRLKYYGTNDVYKDYYHMDLIRMYDHINTIYDLYSNHTKNPSIKLQDLFRDHKNIIQLRNILKLEYPDVIKQLPQSIILRNPPEAFKNKIVILGASAPGLGDRHPSPLKSNELGAFFHANAIDNIINNDFLVEYKDPWIIISLTFILGILTAYIVSRLSFFRSILSVLFIFLTIITLIILSYIYYNISFNVLIPLNSLVITFFITKLVNYFWEIHDRNIILESLVERRTQELEISEERYRRLIELSPDVIIVHSNSEILFINKIGALLLAKDLPEYIIGQKIDQFIHYKSLNNLKEWFRKIVNKEIYNPTMIEKWQTIDGKIIEMEMVSTLLAYKENRAILTIARDVSERKRVERLREDTERVIRHDLKNMLQGILGYADLIRYLQRDEEARLYANSIYTSSLDMLAMINQALDLFKMEEGTYKLKVEVFDLVKVLKEIIIGFSSLLIEKSINVVSKLNNKNFENNETYMIFGEKGHIKNLISNLVKNAIEASPTEQIITINISSDLTNEHQITIHNYGVIPEKVRNNFFDRYSTEGKKDGTGIGTYSALLIARVHYGNITFETSVENGTSLHIFLPKNVNIEN